MHFICTQKNLLTGLSQVSPLAGRNPQLPILHHILLEVRQGVLHLTCTDLEIGAHVEVGGKAEVEGGCTIPARQLLEYVQQLPTTHPILIKKEKMGLVVSTEGFTACFPVTEPDDFPLLPSLSHDSVGVLDARLFGQALQHTLFAAARDETRPEIYSLFIQAEEGKLRVAATDSFRLAERVLNVPSTITCSFLLPVAAAQEVVRLFSKIDEIELFVEKSHVAFRGNGLVLSSRVIDGSYPDYRQIIPHNYIVQGSVLRDDFIRALKVLGVFLSRDTRRVVLEVLPTEGVLKLSIEGSGVGQSEVNVDFNGEGKPLKVLLNIQYLIDGASHVIGDHCVLSFAGANDPVKFSPQNDDMRYLYLVMPIQV